MTQQMSHRCADPELPVEEGLRPRADERPENGNGAARVAAGGESGSIPDLSGLPVRLLLHQRQSRNIWSQLGRDARRLSVLLGTDVAVFLILRALANGLRSGWLGAGAGSWTAYLFPKGFLEPWPFLGALLVSQALVGSYGSGDARRDSGRLFSGAALAALIALYGALWTQSAPVVALRGLAVAGCFGVALTLSRMAVDWIIRRVRPRNGAARALVIAHGDAAWTDLAPLLERTGEFVGVGWVNLDRPAEPGARTQLTDLGPAIHAARAEAVLLWGDLNNDEFAQVLDVALATGCRVLGGARSVVAMAQPTTVWLGGRQLVELTPPALRAWQVALKRTMDVVLSLVALVVVAPLMLGIALAVRLDSPGPALFGQRRVGARGRIFRCFKFRSMRVDAEDILRADPDLYRMFRDNCFKIPAERDPRLTRLGRVLRRTSLDELPQLFNVLRGEMSLIGPRPIEPGELEHYAHHYGDQGVPVFLAVRPGITGAWAVNGRSQVGYPDRAILELEYVRQWTLAGDLGILLRTLPAVIRRHGAH